MSRALVFSPADRIGEGSLAVLAWLVLVEGVDIGPEAVGAIGDAAA
jgi:hypothetical protein